MVEGPERDASFLLDMLLAARDAQRFLSGMDEAAFMASSLHQNAVIRCLEVMGEAAGRVSSATLAANPDIPWSQITGMRHRLIHGYADVQLERGHSRAPPSATSAKPWQTCAAPYRFGGGMTQVIGPGKKRGGVAGPFGPAIGL
jgi:uncharacterized protein with HEPN domain